MKTIIVSLVAAAVLFVFGFIYWGINPLPYTALSQTQDDGVAGQHLLQVFSESGTYMVPDRRNDKEIFNNLHEKGPLAMVHIQREGSPAMESSMFIQGFLHGLVMVFLVVILLKKVINSLTTYWCRVGFVSFIGFTAAFFSYVSNIIWWRLSAGFQLYMALYDLLAWVIVGLILAAFIKPNEARETS